MAKFGFLSVLEEELDKHLDYDFAMDWDKKNHAVEVTFILEAQNSSNVETIDDKGEVSDEDVIFEDYVLFYNPAKSSHFYCSRKAVSSFRGRHRKAAPPVHRP